MKQLTIKSPNIAFLVALRQYILHGGYESLTDFFRQNGNASLLCCLQDIELDERDPYCLLHTPEQNHNSLRDNDLSIF